MQNRITSRSMRFVVVLIVACCMMACAQTPSGPSLADVQVSGVSLQATEGNASLCCCRVAAIAENHNTVPVHVTIKFVGYDENPTFPLATIVHFIKNMQPGTQEPILASGFLLACSRLKDVRVEVDVTGTGSALP
jgi:hypothetical protein